MLLAIAIFLSTMSVGKSEDYFLSNGSSVPGNKKLADEVAGAWMRGVQQAFFTIWKDVMGEIFTRYFEIVDKSHMKDDLKGVLLQSLDRNEPRRDKVEYSSLIENGTIFAWDLNFISNKLTEEREVENIVLEKLRERFNVDGKNKEKNKGWIEYALEQFAKASKEGQDDWLGVGCVLDDADKKAEGKYAVYCRFKALNRKELEDIAAKNSS